jgi:hypothetical protein
MRTSNRQIASRDAIYEQTLAGIMVPQHSMLPDHALSTIALSSQYLRQNGFYHYICLCCR